MSELPPLKFHWYLVKRCEVDVDVHSSFVKYVFPDYVRVEGIKELAEKLRREEFVLETIMKMPRIELRQQALEAVEKSVSCWRMYTGMQKSKAIIDHVKGVFYNKLTKKTVIFCSYADMAFELQEGLADLKPLCLFAKTPYEKRRYRLKRFRETSHNKVLICMLSAAAYEMDITGADHIVFAEYSWNIGQNAQAIMRCHRLGQKQTVNVKWFNLRDSVDHDISHLIRDLSRDLVGGTGPWTDFEDRPIRKVRPSPLQPLQSVQQCVNEEPDQDS